mmetsp:Transcript_37648/g.58773  ORF Transcript_37648/g.58773 Transcript_37648/m.58773 type:complete len:351 (+) Transcript_37648:44-1096(+)
MQGVLPGAQLSKPGRQKAGVKSLSKIFGRQLRRRILRTERQLMPQSCRSASASAQAQPAQNDDLSLGQPIHAAPFRPHEQQEQQEQQHQHVMFEQNAAPMNMSWALDGAPKDENQGHRPANPFMGGVAPQHQAHSQPGNQAMGRIAHQPLMHEDVASRTSSGDWGSDSLSSTSSSTASFNSFRSMSAPVEPPAERHQTEDAVQAYMAMVAQTSGIAVQPQRMQWGKSAGGFGFGEGEAKTGRGHNDKPAHPMSQATSATHSHPATGDQQRSFPSSYNAYQPVAFHQDPGPAYESPEVAQWAMKRRRLEGLQHGGSGFVNEFGFQTAHHEAPHEEEWDLIFQPKELPQISW